MAEKSELERELEESTYPTDKGTVAVNDPCPCTKLIPWKEMFAKGEYTCACGRHYTYGGYGASWIWR